MEMHPRDSHLLHLLFSPDPEGHLPPKVREHLARCSRCQQRVDRLLALRSATRPRQAPAWPAYEEALTQSIRRLRSWRARFEQERAAARGLFAELMKHPPERRRLLVRNHQRFQTWGVFELMIERSRELTFQDPAQGEALARLALDLSSQLDPLFYGAEQIEDYRARAWSYIGNAYRVGANLQEAERAFEAALGHLRRGTREPMERAIFLDLKASLLRAERRFGEAIRLLKRARTLFLAVGETHRAGRSLVKTALVHSFAGHPEKAIPLYHQALELIDPGLEPRLLLSTWHNLIDDLADLGRAMEAQKLFVKAAPLYRQFHEAWVHNRRDWVEGKIARGLGRREKAEGLFLRARAGFVAEDAAYDTALVSLDLATLYAEQGRNAELRRLAEEMVPIFSSRQIHREALAALVLWKQAVEAETAGVELVAEIAAYLRRARYDQALRFQESF